MSKLTQVDEVAIRLMDLDSLFCKDTDNWCRKTNPRGHFCTRKKGHTGFHVEHFYTSGIAYPMDKSPWSDSDDCT